MIDTCIILATENCHELTNVHGAQGGSLTMCLICDAGVGGAQFSAATGFQNSCTLLFLGCQYPIFTH